MNGWDTQLFWLINRDGGNALFDWLMPVLSAIEVWLPIMGIVLVIVAWRGGSHARWMLAALALALILSDAVVGNGLKKAFNRARPRDAMSGVIVRDVARRSPKLLALFAAPVIKTTDVKKPATTGNSLPSNHTLNLFAAATVIALFFRRAGPWMFLLAGAVAYSRVYVGAHWPSDLPPSAVLGILIGLLTTAFVRRWSMPKQA
jgi:undecaprenyl-diphosphatase